MLPITDFPILVNGSCDGMGCGAGVCWCDENYAMNLEYQRVYNKPWINSWTKEEGWEHCKVWEDAWRFGTSRLTKMIDIVGKDSYDIRRAFTEAQRQINRKG